MGEMVEQFETKLASMSGQIEHSLWETMRDLYSTIKSGQVKNYGYSDIESVFSVVEMLANNRPYKELGHAVAYILSQSVDLRNRIANEQDQKAAQELSKHMKSFVKDACKLTDVAVQKVEDIYGELFSNFRNWGPVETKSIGGKEYYRGDWRMYTTNYDRALESYWEGTFDLEDCFKQVAGVNTMDIAIAHSVGHKLIKLHGSIDWYRLKNKQIVKSETSKIRIGKNSVEGDLMIYPIQQKDLYLDPWLHFFVALKQDLMTCDVWLVIGYQFNDEFIRNIFSEALEKRMSEGRNPKFIIVLPGGKAASLFENIFRGNPRNHPINGYFGVNGTLTAIINAVTSKQ